MKIPEKCDFSQQVVTRKQKLILNLRNGELRIILSSNIESLTNTVYLTRNHIFALEGKKNIRIRNVFTFLKTYLTGIHTSNIPIKTKNEHMLVLFSFFLFQHLQLWRLRSWKKSL